MAASDCMLGNANIKLFGVLGYLMSSFCLVCHLQKKSCSDIGKIGYGTVSEALAYKLPFVFVRRDYFNEEPFLRNMLEVETFWALTLLKANIKLCVVIKYLA
jgi:hypothetical protein